MAPWRRGPVSAVVEVDEDRAREVPRVVRHAPLPGLAEDPADVDDPEIRVRQAGGEILGRDQGHAGSVADRRA